MSVTSLTDSFVIVGDEMPETNEETIVEPRPPEMKSMYVVSNVRNRYARTVVTSKYVNLDKSAQEATFSIVLPDTAFIAGFVMEINEKKYEAYVKEKEEAKQEYQEAVSKGRAAAHVSVSARDSNKFTVSVNVEPQSDVTFILTYEELLVRKHSKYEMVVNLHPGQLLDDLGVDIHINETRPIINIETPSIRSGNEITSKATKNELAIIINDENGVAHISFHPTVEQQKEMAIALSNDSNNTGILGQFVVEYDVQRDPLGGEVLVNDGYFVHFFAPTELKQIPKHVVFVLDVSGSMSGRKIEQLKQAMHVILSELNSEDYFNIIKFESNVQILFNNNSLQENACTSLPVTAENIHKAQQVVDSLKARGSTNISEALYTALSLTSKGISVTEQNAKLQAFIVFLTDGKANGGERNTNRIVETVLNRNDCENPAAIFTLAFGENAEEEFLKELAVKNSGFLRIIYEAADASLQLQDFYKQISSPLLTNVNFKYSEDVKEVTKHKFDILFDGSEFVVTGKVDEMVDEFVFVEASTLDGTNKFCPTITTISPKPDAKEEYGNLERLWAYMTIKQLLDKKYEKKLSDDNDNQADQNKIDEGRAKQEALKLALKYSFVTPITSLVVVKPDESTSEEILEDGRKNIEAISPRGTRTKFACMRKQLGTQKCKKIGSSLPKLLYSYCPENKPETDHHARVDGRPKRRSQFLNFNLLEQLKPKSIHFECNVENHVASITEKRIYENTDNKSRSEKFTMVLRDKAVFTEFTMEIDGQVYKSFEQEAQEEYKEASINGLNAALANFRNSARVAVEFNLAPHSKVTLLFKYEKILENKNGKYEMAININPKISNIEMTVNVKLNETRPIKNLDIPLLRNQTEDTKNECSKINRINENEIHVEFCPTIEQQRNIFADETFSGQFIIEYEIESDSSIEDSVTNVPSAVLVPYLVAVKRNN